MGTDNEESHLWMVVQEWMASLPYPPNQSKLAERIGVSRSAVSDWKKGVSSPGAVHLHALAKEMQSVAGPGIYERLLEAVNQDQGYLPSARPAARAARKGESEGTRRRRGQDEAAQAEQAAQDGRRTRRR